MKEIRITKQEKELLVGLVESSLINIYQSGEQLIPKIQIPVHKHPEAYQLINKIGIGKITKINRYDFWVIQSKKIDILLSFVESDIINKKEHVALITAFIATMGKKGLKIPPEILEYRIYLKEQLNELNEDGEIVLVEE